MEKDLLSTLEEIQKNSNKTNKKISVYLIDLLFEKREIEFEKIIDLSRLLNVSYSSIDRFVKEGNWFSFKHFFHSFKSFHNHFLKKEDEVLEISKTNYAKVDNSKEVAKKMNNNLFFICSKKTRPIGYWIEERFSDIGKKISIFEGEIEDLQRFTNKITEHDVVFLITVSGSSLIINKTLENIAKLPRNRMPHVYILSSAKWLNIFNKYDFISSIQIQANYKEQTWESYNYLMIDLLVAITDIISSFYKRIKK